MIKQAIPVIHVSDSLQAESFYCDLLGFKKTFTHRPSAQADPCYLGISRDGAHLHLSSFSGDGVSGSVVTLIVDKVDDLYQEFSAAGVEIALTPTDQTWGTREMYVHDQDHNCLRFQQ
jgi:uncharacterized glyoxalase superfamily protein PhnB